jgi:hypothetical protein
MDQATFTGDVMLNDAKIGSDLEMDHSSFAKTVNGSPLTVGGALFMDHTTFTAGVNLSGVTVERLWMDHATFTGDVMLNDAKIGNSLGMNQATFTGEVFLRGAKVGSDLEMDRSSFAKTVDGQGLTAGDAFFMRDGASFKGPVILTYAKVATLLDLRGANAWTIDLSEGKAGEIQIGSLQWWCAEGKPFTGVPLAQLPLADSRWRSARCDGADVAVLPKFILRNFQVGAFQDSPDAWPPVLDLEGFRYDRLGGFGTTESTDMATRSPDEWIDWLARDRTFKNQPYTQLSTVLAKAGYRDPADDIQFAGRRREREEICKQSNQPASCAWLTTLSVVAGYGVGLHTFRVLWGVSLFTLLGAVVLSFSRKGRQHGVGWRLGASLHRLLPIISLSKEFEDFFDNRPTDLDSAHNLNRFQVGYFAVHAIVGWALGLILLAAMSGLTSKA